MSIVLGFRFHDMPACKLIALLYQTVEAILSPVHAIGLSDVISVESRRISDYLFESLKPVIHAVSHS